VALVLTIAGVDRTDKLKAGSLKLKKTADGKQGVADFTLIDFTPGDDENVVVADDGPSDYATEVLADSPNWFFTFDESVGAFADGSGNGITCTETIAVTRGVDGAFLGSDAITASSDQLTLGYTASSKTAETIEGWFKTTSTGFCRIEHNRDAVGLALQLGIGNGGLGGVAGTVNAYINGTSFWQGRHSSVTVNDGEWHHIAATWAAPAASSVLASQIKIYIDGALDASIADSGNTGSATSPISGQNSMTLLDQGGPISADEMSFYSTELSAARILAHYEAGANATTYYDGSTRNRKVTEWDIGHWFCQVSCQDDAVQSSPLGAAPFAFSDTPNLSTTFPYIKLDVDYVAARGASYSSLTTSLALTTRYAGIEPGMTITVTAANHGLSADEFYVQGVDTSFPTQEPVYTIKAGDSPVTLIDTIQGTVDSSVDAATAALSIDVPKVLSALPELPDDMYPPGTLGFLTTDEKIYRVNADGDEWIKQVDGADILVSSITAGAIAAGAIGAQALAAEILIATTKFVAGDDFDSGARVEIDEHGIRNYDSSEQLTVRIPTDGSPVIVKGEVEATSLVSTSSAELRGDNTLPTDSVTTLEYGVGNPTAAPGVDIVTPSLTLSPAPTYPGAGICWDEFGAAGGATQTYWIGANPTIGTQLDMAYEYNASTGALLRTIQKTGSTTTVTATLGATSHVSDSAQAREQTGTQVATPLTIPGGLTNVEITKVSIYVTGYNGGTPTIRGAVWSNGNTFLGQTETQTLSSESFSTGNSNHYNLDMTSPLSVSAGTTYRVGWFQSSNEGIQWDRDDGSSKTQYRGTGAGGNLSGITTSSGVKPNVYITYTHDVGSAAEGTPTKIIGVARQGSYVWCLDSSGILYRYVQSSLAYVDKFDLSSRITVDANAGLFWDGTNLVIVTTSGTSGTDQFKFVKVNTSGAWVSDHTASGLSMNGATAVTRAGWKANPSYYYAVVNGTGYRLDNSTYAVDTSLAWGSSSEMSDGVTNGPDGDGVGWSVANPSKVWLYEGWYWTSGGPTFYVCYSWYDITGTTHETDVSPRTAITPGQRRRLTISNPAIPGASGEPPDRVRVYMIQSASDPGGTGYKLQSTDALTSRNASGYISVGAANPGTNSFPSGTAAILQSSGDGWQLSGDGIFLLEEIGDPSSPASNKAHLFVKDNGSGKTQLCVKFSSDSSIVIATQV
jgi:hypothetical protein